VPDFEANSPSPALNAVYCIDWVQRLASLPRVSHPIVSSMNRPRQTNFVTGRVLQSRGRIKKAFFSNTLLPQRFILRRICRCLELYRPLDLLPKSGVKARATAEPRRSLRTFLKTYQTFPA